MFTRWQPFGNVQNEMKQLHDEMNRIFGRMENGGSQYASRNAYPPLNLWEDDGNLYVETELPGFALEDMEIFVTGGNRLTLKGERMQAELKEGAWHRRERAYGKFSRAIELPRNVDSEKVSAAFQDGVLKVTLPKQEAAKPRRIEVKYCEN